MRNLTLFRPSRQLFDPFTDWDRFFENSLSAPLSKQVTQENIGVRLDVREDEKAFTLCAEIPGVAKENVSVNLDGDTLTISGKKEFKAEEKTEQFHRMECSYGSFSRSLALPDNVDASAITAEHKDGVLHICLPKTKQAEQKQTQIQIK